MAAPTLLFRGAAPANQSAAVFTNNTSAPIVIKAFVLTNPTGAAVIPLINIGASVAAGNSLAVAGTANVAANARDTSLSNIGLIVQPGEGIFVSGTGLNAYITGTVYDQNGANASYVTF